MEVEKGCALKERSFVEVLLYLSVAGTVLCPAPVSNLFLTLLTFPVFIGDGDLRLKEDIGSDGLGLRALRNGVALFCLGPNNGVEGVEDFLSNLDFTEFTDPVFAEENIPRE